MRLTNMYEVQRYIKACAKRANINVVFTDDKNPRTDGTTVYVPMIKQSTTDEQLAEYLYTIEHEAAHHVHSDFKALKYDATTFSGQMHNILEDYRTNRAEADDFRGFEQNLEQVHPRLVNELVKTYKKQSGGWTSDQKLREDALFAVAAVAEREFGSSPDMREAAEKLANVSPEVAENVRKLQPYVKDITKLVDQRTADSLNLAERIIKEVFGLDPEAEAQNKQPMPTPVANPDAGNGKKGEQRKPGDGEAEGNGDGNEEGEPGDNPNYDKKTGKKHAVGAVKDHTYVKRVVTDHSIEDYYGPFEPALPDANVIINDYDPSYLASRLSDGGWRGSRAMFENAERQYKSNYHKEVSDKGASVEGFADKVRRLLQIRTRDRYEYGVKRGKLDQSRLARITLRDAHGFNERVFKRKITNDALDTAVTVLLDCSGSMGGAKWTHAVQAGVLLNHTIANALNIPLELLAFTDTETATVLYEVKPFYRLRLSDEEVLTRLARCGGFMNANADGEAILLAYDRLVRRREKRKLLVVVSDGEPACCRGGDIGTFTRDVIKEIQDGRRVEIYGLGILSSAVKRFYKNNSVVSKAEDLEPALLQLIDSKLI